MKKLYINDRQAGFTLIELVVVIVILGVLAATAVPKFASLTDNANTAVAQGIVGAISSSAVIQLGAGSGVTPTFNTAITNTDFSNVPTGSTVNAGAGMSGTAYTINGATLAGGTLTCTADPANFTVTVGGQNATGTLSSGLCSG